MISPAELVGFISVEEREPITALKKHLDFEEVRKIQNRIPVDWPNEIVVAKWDASVAPIEKYLEDNNFLKSDNEKEFFIICRFGVLIILFNKHVHTKNFAKEMKFIKKGNVITIEELYSEIDKVKAENNAVTNDIGRIAEKKLLKLPKGETEKVHGEKRIQRIAKKRFFYSDGTIINLFTSRMIDGFYEKEKDLIPLDLKLTLPKFLISPEIFARNFKQAIFADYITGGITHILGVQEKWATIPKKLLVVEGISSLVESDYLTEFTTNILAFMLKLSNQNTGEQILVKEMVHRRNVHYSVKIHFKTALEDLSFFPCDPTPISNKERIGKCVSNEHELVILGSHTTPLARQRFFDTDIIKMESFKKGFYEEFMVKPDKIIFYGTKEEYAEVRRFMSRDQTFITSRAT